MAKMLENLYKKGKCDICKEKKKIIEFMIGFNRLKVCDECLEELYSIKERILKNDN